LTAQELIEFRQRHGMTQTELAKALGCSLRSITNWEKEKQAIPDSIALAAAAVAFGLPPYRSSSQV